MPCNIELKQKINEEPRWDQNTAPFPSAVSFFKCSMIELIDPLDPCHCNLQSTSNVSISKLAGSQHQAALQRLGYWQWCSQITCSLIASNNQHPTAAPHSIEHNIMQPIKTQAAMTWPHGEASSSSSTARVTKRWRGWREAAVLGVTCSSMIAVGRRGCCAWETVAGRVQAAALI